MNKYEMKSHGPLMTNESVATDVFKKIMAMDPSVNQVVIDMRGIITMTTQCVKAIFVRLYQELGYSIYYQNILFENKSDTVSKLITSSIDEYNKSLR